MASAASSAVMLSLVLPTSKVLMKYAPQARLSQNQRTGSSAAPSAESELKKARELLTKKRRKKFAPRESEILAKSVYGGRATAGTPGDVALCRESRSCRTATPGRLEISPHGHAIHPTSANWRIRSIGFLRKVGEI